MQNKISFLVLIVFTLIGTSCKPKYSMMESSSRSNYQPQKKISIEYFRKSIDLPLEKITPLKKEVEIGKKAKKEIKKTISEEKIKPKLTISKMVFTKKLKKHFQQAKKKTKEKDSKKTENKLPSWISLIMFGLVAILFLSLFSIWIFLLFVY